MGKRTNYILALTIILCVLMFGWTTHIISSVNNANIQTAISAFNS